MLVDGKPLLVRGMTWDIVPPGHNHKYNEAFWKKPEAFIRRLVDRDMGLMKRMGVNLIRTFFFIPPRWITYIHDKHGIHTMVNDLMGRYGVRVDGRWIWPINYGDARVRRAIIENATRTVRRYKDVRGVLLFAFGNENNYGFEWTSDAIGDLPKGERHRARARKLYSLFEEVFRAAKAVDKRHPLVLVNGDVQYLDLIAKSCRSFDIMGANVYRGLSAARYQRRFNKDDFDKVDVFTSVKATLDRPLLFTELGCDAYNARLQREDVEAQAFYFYHQWKEIYGKVHGQGQPGNSLGGVVFHWKDQWWKRGQIRGLDVHDTAGNWSNPQYAFDYTPGGRDNMQEEWWGVCRMSPARIDGIHVITPRPGYFVLQKIWRLDPYGRSPARVAAHFRGIEVPAAWRRKKARRAVLPLVLYDDHAGDRVWPYTPSGHMGNHAAIKRTDSWQRGPRSGKTCIRITYKDRQGWAGVAWLNPAGDWGSAPGGRDLSGARALSFWARGETGAERVTFKLGILSAEKPHPDSATATLGPVTLGSRWRRYEIPLAGKDLSRIKSGFVWTVEASGRPVTFYLDDIQYQ